MASKYVGYMGKVMQMDRTYRETAAQPQGLLKVHWSILPFVAIPSAAGAKSETTVAAVITSSKTRWHGCHLPHSRRSV